MCQDNGKQAFRRRGTSLRMVLDCTGVHSATNGPIHPLFSKDKAFYSHKKKCAGLCCKLGVHLHESKLMWMNGPFRAGPNDNQNFAKGGEEEGTCLKEKLESIGKKALGDKTHNGHPDECSTFNAFDDPAVKKFKSRAQMRHEQFNGMMKEFSSLHYCFGHEEAKFAVCFEAVAVICQCRMEIGEPLFNVLAGIGFEEDSGSKSELDEEIETETDEEWEDDI